MIASKEDKNRHNGQRSFADLKKKDCEIDKTTFPL